jgi:predicted esterase
MGGRGAWYLSARQPKLFTGAIVMAGPIGDDPLDRRGLIPTYVIHSRADQVVPFGPAEQLALELEKRGRLVKFDPLADPGHNDIPQYLEALRRGANWIAAAWQR